MARKRSDDSPYTPRHRCPKAPGPPSACVAYRGLGAPPVPRCMYCDRALRPSEAPPPYIAGATIGRRAPPSVWRTAGDPFEVQAMADRALETIEQAIPPAALVGMLTGEAPSDKAGAGPQRRQSMREPPIDGWKNGFRLLLDGLCPWCGHPIQAVSINRIHGFTWDCFDGCNP